MRPRVGMSLLLGLCAAAGCGSNGATEPRPKSITADQVRELPLEEAGDLGIRQNLVDRPKKAILGRDTLTP
jgi:hypothetical protein